MIIDLNDIDLVKAITRKDAKGAHKDLPPGGVWRTMNGHHIYIKDGKVLAGAIPGVTKAKKATKAQLAEHQAAMDAKGTKKDAKNKGKNTPKAKGDAKQAAGASSKGTGGAKGKKDSGSGKTTNKVASKGKKADGTTKVGAKTDAKAKSSTKKPATKSSRTGKPVSATGKKKPASEGGTKSQSAAKKVAKPKTDPRDSKLKELAAGSSDGMDMWANAHNNPEHLEALKSKLKEMEGKTSDKLDRLHKEYGGSELPDYKPMNPKAMSDFEPGTPSVFPKDVAVTIKDDHHGEASAEMGASVIVRSDMLDMPEDTQKHIMIHEIGHVISNAYPGLAAHVWDNPQDALGRTNQKKGYFDGVSYTPEESWAEAFAQYHTDPEHLKKHNPKAYDFVDTVLPKIHNYKQFIQAGLMALAKAKKERGLKPAESSPASEDHYEIFHGTKLYSLESILEKGFKPNGTEDDFGDAVYFKSPSFDAKDHEDWKQWVEERKSKGKNVPDSYANRRGNDTEKIVNSFANRSTPLVIKATIAKEHLLDCTNGRPKELDDLINEFEANSGGTRRVRVAFKHILGMDVSDKSDSEVGELYIAHKEDFKKATGKSNFMAGKLSPYEVYAKKHGIKAIVDKLNEYKDEGWQVGVYDPSIINITDHGKKVAYNPDKRTAELLKALRKAKAAGYCLVHHEIDEDGLHLHIGVSGGEDMEKSLTRKAAKSAHKDLPPGGVWRTMNGHHIYIKDGKVLAGAIPGVTDATKVKKATKKQLAEHQKTIDAKKKVPAPKKAAASKAKEDAKKKVPPPKKAPVKKEPQPPGKKAPAKKAPAKKFAAPKTKRTIEHVDKVTSSKTVLNAWKGWGKGTGDYLEGIAEVADNKNATVLGVKNDNGDYVGFASIRYGTYNSGKDKGKEVALLEELNSAFPKEGGGIGTALITSAVKEAYDKGVHKFMLQGTGGARGFYEKLGMKRDKGEYGDDDTIEFTFDKKGMQAFLKKQGIGEPAKKAPAKKTAKPKDIRSDAQKNRELAYDVGDKVGGARKDEFIASFKDKPTAKNLEELEKMSGAIAEKMVTKAHLLPKYDFQAEHDNGVDLPTAILKKLIYDRIAPKPEPSTPETRKAYMMAMRKVQRHLEGIKSFENFRDALRELSNMARKASRHDDAKQKLESYNSGTSRYSYLNTDLMNQYIEEGKEAKAFMDFNALGSKFYNMLTNYESLNRSIDTVRKNTKEGWEKYLTPQEKKKSTKRGEENKRWEREAVSEHLRKGGKETKVKKPEDLMKEFNLRGVEFGHWVNDSSGLFHLKRSAEAFDDLADIIGIDKKDISLNGRLAIAFGARGKGGALAHYEPDRKVINMTKHGGAGSLAHEWGHAMDNILFQYSNGGAESLGLASQGQMGNSDPKLKALYDNLMDAITKPAPGEKGGSTQLILDSEAKQLTRYYPEMRRQVEGGMEPMDVYNHWASKIHAEYDRIIANVNDPSRMYYEKDPVKRSKNVKKYENERKRKLTDIGHYLAAELRRKQNGGKYGGDHYKGHIEISTGKSEYLTRMEENQPGKMQNGVHYWSAPEEMFARVFESYVQDTMKKNKRENNYLVHGTSEGAVKAMGAPFPIGKERAHMHKAMKNLLDYVGKKGTLKKALLLEVLAKGHGDMTEELRKSMGSDTGVMPKRSAYNVPNPEEVIYIPVNRLKVVYQTEAATNWDKVNENKERMERGEHLEPVVIGLNYDIHDGHHRYEASKLLGYEHIPCVVKGGSDLDRQRAIEAYSEVWKSIQPDPTNDQPKRRYDYMYRGVGQKELDAINRTGVIKSKGKGNDDDKGLVMTCFSNLFSQAEGYARSNYDLYDEKAAYVLVVRKPYWIEEDEHGELVSIYPVSKKMIEEIVPIPQDNYKNQ